MIIKTFDTKSNTYEFEVLKIFYQAKLFYYNDRLFEIQIESENYEEKHLVTNLEDEIYRQKLVNNTKLGEILEKLNEVILSFDVSNNLQNRTSLQLMSGSKKLIRSMRNHESLWGDTNYAKYTGYHEWERYTAIPDAIALHVMTNDPILDPRGLNIHQFIILPHNRYLVIDEYTGEPMWKRFDCIGEVRYQGGNKIISHCVSQEKFFNLFNVDPYIDFVVDSGVRIEDALFWWPGYDFRRNRVKGISKDEIRLVFGNNYAELTKRFRIVEDMAKLN